MTKPDDTRDDPPPAPDAPNPGPDLVDVYENRPAGYVGPCLRPLGLCELGGSCDTCWYSPDHPRHRADGSS